MEVPELFNLLSNTVYGAAAKSVAEDEQFEPVVLAYLADGSLKVMEIGFLANHKDMMAAIFNGIAKRPDVTACCFATEAWQVQRNRATWSPSELPSEAEDRTEVVVVSLVMGNQRGIVRHDIDRASKSLVKGEIRIDLDGTLFEGRFVPAREQVQ